MPTTLLDQAVPGMTLQANVCDRNGRVLLGRGSVVSERHLRIFKTWGITEIEVDAPPPSAAPAVATGAVPPIPKSMEAAKKKAELLFKHTDPTHPAIQQLFYLCVHRIAAARQETADHGG